jgi:uncharacterized membrane protein (Fun14 family)
MNNIVESFGPTAATLGGGFLSGILIGYALKKIIKMMAIIVGLFLAGLAYLQYHQIANINWNKLQTVSEGAITTISNAIIMQIPGISSGDTSHAAATASSSLSMTSFGIPLTGSMSQQDLLLDLSKDNKRRTRRNNLHFVTNKLTYFSCFSISTIILFYMHSLAAVM